MIIHIDTREVNPLHFTPDGLLVDVRRTKLDVGDYCAEYVDGSRCPIYFERKSLGDCWGTMTKGHARFKRELDRAKTSGVKLILAIEGTDQDVLDGFSHSIVSGDTMMRKLQTMWLKYDLMPMFFASRKSMAWFIQEFYYSFGRLYKTGCERRVTQ